MKLVPTLPACVALLLGACCDSNACETPPTASSPTAPQARAAEPLPPPVVAAQAPKALVPPPLTESAPEPVLEDAQRIASELALEFGQLGDAADAQDFAARGAPQVERLVAANKVLGAGALELGALKQALADVEAKFAAQPEALDALQPLLDSLKTLFP